LRIFDGSIFDPFFRTHENGIPPDCAGTLVMPLPDLQIPIDSGSTWRIFRSCVAPIFAGNPPIPLENAEWMEHTSLG
jgi:hypothetical protein